MPALNLDIAAAQVVIVGPLRTIVRRQIAKVPILILVHVHKNRLRN